MIVFAQSRPRVALAIAALPFLFPVRMVVQAFYAAREAAYDLYDVARDDLVPAMRYVLTGKSHEAAIVERASELKAFTVAKAVSTRDAVASFFSQHVEPRMAALFVLLLLPFLFMFAVGKMVADEGVFGDLTDAFVDLSKCIWNGQDFRTL